MGMNDFFLNFDFLYFYMITIEGSDAQEIAMLCPPKNTFDQLNSTGKRVECLCDPLEGNY